MTWQQEDLPLNGHAPTLTPAHVEPLATIYQGDCLAVMAELAASSIDAIVTDPPYGLEFMGKAWDTLDAAWPHAALRVLKPGAHLVAFGGTRTFHRLACALEDAGFELRDCLMWLYGSGFPKSLDVSKAIDKAAGIWRGQAGEITSANGAMSGPNYERTEKGEPATVAAAAWKGWGTALKPAWEPILLARKPLAAGTVAANVLAHGTGALNVDGCRIEHASEDDWAASQAKNPGRLETVSGVYGANRPQQSVNAAGRWPANVLLDAAAAAQLDAQSGELHAGMTTRSGHGSIFGSANGEPASAQRPTFTDSGGASRFFYTAKADAEDRDGSTHPTVKPVDLMKWLITLVTPPGGIVLDPFLGSGTTVYAARALGIRSIGIEREPDYVAAAIWRLRQGVLL